jgi:hypothetical protein
MHPWTPGQSSQSIATDQEPGDQRVTAYPFRYLKAQSSEQSMNAREPRCTKNCSSDGLLCGVGPQPPQRARIPRKRRGGQTIRPAPLVRRAPAENQSTPAARALCAKSGLSTGSCPSPRRPRAIPEYHRCVCDLCAVMRRCEGLPLSDQTRRQEQLSRVVDEKVKHQAATFSSVVVVSSSVTLIPSLNFTPASTSATSSCPLTRRQRSWAASSSL